MYASPESPNTPLCVWQRKVVKDHMISLLFRVTPYNVSTLFEAISNVTLEILALLACYAGVDC